jgi:hypothetical protein
MPVVHRDPPAAANDAVQAALAHFATVPPEQLNALAGAAPADLAQSAPHEVFTLGLDDLRAAPSMAAARPTGWRYLLREGDQVVASAETAGTAFSHFNRGPFVASTAVALQAAEAAPQARARSYDLRLLHVPALSTMALWLHGDGHDGGGGDDGDGDGGDGGDVSDDDVLVPLDPAPPGVEPNRPYPAHELLELLAQRAAQVPRLAADDTRGG